MEAVKAAPSSQGLLHPQPLPTCSAGTLPGRGMSQPVPSVLLPRCHRVCEAKDPLERAQHPPWDRAAQGTDDAAGRHPDTAAALQPLQEPPPPQIGTAAHQDRGVNPANTAQVLSAAPRRAGTPRCQRCLPAQCPAPLCQSRRGPSTDLPPFLLEPFLTARAPLHSCPRKHPGIFFARFKALSHPTELLLSPSALNPQPRLRDFHPATAPASTAGMDYGTSAAAIILCLISAGSRQREARLELAGTLVPVPPSLAPAAGGSCCLAGGADPAAKLLQPLHRTQRPAKTLCKQLQPRRLGLYPPEIQAGGVRSSPG